MAQTLTLNNKDVFAACYHQIAGESSLDVSEHALVYAARGRVGIVVDDREIGVIFFPKWVREHPEITVRYQNDFIPLMEESRVKYETYPKYVVPEFGDIFYAKNEGANNEKVISQAPYEGIVEDIVSGKLSFSD